MNAERRFGSYITIRDGRFLCGICDESLGPVEKRWKTNVRVVEESPSAMGVHWINERDDFVFRRFLCPSCGTQLETEACRKGDEIQPWYQPPDGDSPPAASSASD